MNQLRLQEAQSLENKDHSFLDSNRHLGLSKHKQREYPRAWTYSPFSHKIPKTCLYGSHQDLTKYKKTKQLNEPVEEIEEATHDNNNNSHTNQSGEVIGAIG